MTRAAFLRPVSAIAVFATFCGIAEAQTPFSHKGFDVMHPGSSAAPSEQVDPASGALLVTGTDLVLPGNAGLDLRIQRVYNSAVYPDYASGSTALEEDSWAGIGWKLHFGRILDPDAIGAGQTQIEMGDGSRHALYHSIANTSVWTTLDFWIYDRTAHTLKLPNGVIYTFDRSVFLNDRLGTVRYVTEIQDAYGNRITFTYFDQNGPPDGIAAIDQYLGTQSRHVSFTYDPTLKSLATMSYLGHTWTYIHDAAGPTGYGVLRSVQPPIGRGWQYSYSASMTGELTAITTPAGGQVNYVYGDAVRRAGSLSQTNRVIASRSISGPSLTAGTWTYAYGTGTNQDTTVISCPCGVQRYRFNGTGISGDFTAWSSGTIAEVTSEETDGTVRETRTFTWARGEPISADPVAGVNGVWTDGAVYKPLLSQAAVTRGSHTWTTQNSYHTLLGNYNDYGRPWHVEELGDTAYQRRITERVFAYAGFTLYILDRVERETVTMQVSYSQWVGITEWFSTYNSTGFQVALRIDDVTTTFEPTSTGNVAAVIDPLGHRTEYTYSWGRVSQIVTPKVTTTYAVSPEGLVTSETAGGLTTSYEFDASFRPTLVRPPGVNPIAYEYDNTNGLYLRVTRDQATTRSDVDGFGRVVLTTDAANVKARVTMDACGRTTFASVPYTAGAGTVGTITAYDALGRVTGVTDPANNTTQFAYNGVSFTRADALNRQTSFENMAFGAPGTERLVAVTDATNTVTQYEYDVRGTLTKVSGPAAGVTRTWTLNSHGWLGSETQPESGTTTYTYDAAGNLTQVTNAAAEVTTFQYDENNRLISRDGPGTDSDITTTYVTGADRVASVSGGGVVTTFAYDATGRVSSRTDVTAGQTWTSQYAYDLNDNLTSLTYPSGRVVTYTYDTIGRLTAVRNNGAILADQFTYGDTGALASFRTGTIVQTLTYDAATRIQRITAGGGLDLTYSYNGVSQVTQIADPRPLATQTFSYDPLDRLQTAQGDWGTTSWTYDAGGNRLTETNGITTTYNYNTTTQRLMSMSGGLTDSFGYDDAGRLISDSRGSYSYSGRGQLAQVIGPSVTATYGYDGGGSRLARTVNGVMLYTTHAIDGQPLSEYQTTCGAIAWTRDTVYAGGRVLGAVRANLTQPTVAFVASSASVGEAQTSATTSVRLTTGNGAATTCPVTVAYHTVAATATAGADYTVSDGTLTFPTGTASGATQTIALGIVNDGTDEADETFTINLASAVGATLGTTSSSVITITDDDPTPALTIGDVAAMEGQTTPVAMVFPVTLSNPSAFPVTVAYDTAAITATAGSDYTSISGTLTIPAGSTSGSITVNTIPDLVAEPAETFLVELWAPTRATIARAPATGTIQNDDPYDLLALDTTTGHLERWRYSGAERIQRDNLVPDGTNEPSTVVAVGDLNADGQVDLIRQNPDTTLVVWFMSGATRIGTATLNPATPPNSNWFIAAIYDVDGDGQHDILWQNSVEGSLRVWYMNGTTMTSTELLTVNRSNDVSWRIVGTGDINGDGHRDLVWWHPIDGWLQVWTMNGTTRLSSVMMNPDRVTDVNWKPMAVTDVNADGTPDLVWEHLNDGWMQVWYMDGLNLTDSVWMVPPQILPSWRILGSFTR